MEPSLEQKIGLTASVRNEKEPGQVPDLSAGSPIQRWLANRGREVYFDLLALRGLHRAEKLPGISKSSIVFDWLRAKRAPGGGRGMEILRFCGRSFACPQRAAARVAFQEIFVEGVYDFASAHPSPRMLDCGANIGLATLFFKLRYPESRIEAIEADPNLASLLERNIRSNQLGGVRVHACALAGSEGEIEFYPSTEFPLSGSFRSSRAGGKAVVEYHHNLEGGRAGLSGFLGLWENAGSAYQLPATGGEKHGPRFQDILIRFWRVADREGLNRPGGEAESRRNDDGKRWNL